MLRILHLIIFCFVWLGSFGQTHSEYAGEIINKIDSNRKRQGPWVDFEMGNSARREPYYIGREEGDYIDGKKVGVWKRYYATGELQNEITYMENGYDAYIKAYYKNGNCRYEGHWQETYHGYMEGLQHPLKHYYENGCLHIENDLSTYTRYSQDSCGILEQQYHRVLKGSGTGLQNISLSRNEHGSYVTFSNLSFHHPGYKYPNDFSVASRNKRFYLSFNDYGAKSSTGYQKRKWKWEVYKFRIRKIKLALIYIAPSFGNHGKWNYWDYEDPIKFEVEKRWRKGGVWSYRAKNSDGLILDKYRNYFKPRVTRAKF